LREAVDSANERAAQDTGAIFIPPVVPDKKAEWSDTVHLSEPGSRLLAQAVVQRLMEAPRFQVFLKERASKCRPPSKPEVAKLSRGLEGTVENSQKH
jgi:hypothetical protein